jgi:4'-phosphopantetheinyl transferase
VQTNITDNNLKTMIPIIKSSGKVMHKDLGLNWSKTDGLKRNCAKAPIGNQIYACYVSIDSLLEEAKNFYTMLSQEEKAYALKCHLTRNRDLFVVRRGVLRLLLSSHLDCKPHQVNIGISDHGKPNLKESNSENSLQFSISHSGGYAVFAFGKYSRIGVDIEEIRVIHEIDEIVSQYFTPREKAEMLACPIDCRLEKFYRFWTRKEAVLKAQGIGLLGKLDSADVAMGEHSGTLKVLIKDGAVAEEYSVTDIEGLPSFAAAVAVDGSHPTTQISVQFFA